MAKSGLYLNGKELLECQLDKLTEVQRLEAKIETLNKVEHEIIVESNKVNITFFRKFLNFLKT